LVGQFHEKEQAESNRPNKVSQKNVRGRENKNSENGAAGK